MLLKNKEILEYSLDRLENVILPSLYDIMQLLDNGIEIVPE